MLSEELDDFEIASYFRKMTIQNLFKNFKISPETVHLAVMYYVRYPLSLRQVEDILHERGIGISYETRGGPTFSTS